MRTNQHESLAVETPEEKDHSGWAPASIKGWHLKAPRKKILQRMSTSQHERLTVETTEEKDHSG